MRKIISLLVIFLLLIVITFRCSSESGEKNVNSTSGEGEQLTSNVKSTATFEIADSSKIDTLPSGLMIYIIEKGSGKVPERGETVIAHYSGKLLDGTIFDSSFDRGAPFTFQVGVGQVIKGWDEAFTTLPVGTKAILIIPPELGYGERQVGPIPPNSTLIFYVELLGVTQ